MVTPEQKQARLEDQLARLKTKNRKLETGQKIIIGGMMLSLADKNPAIATQLKKWINEEVTRKIDKERLKTIEIGKKTDLNV